MEAERGYKIKRSIMLIARVLDNGDYGQTSLYGVVLDILRIAALTYVVAAATPMLAKDGTGLFRQGCA